MSRGEGKGAPQLSGEEREPVKGSGEETRSYACIRECAYRDSPRPLGPRPFFEVGHLGGPHSKIASIFGGGPLKGLPS